MTTQKDVKTYNSSIMNDRGKKLFCKYWEPADKPRALVFLCHGYAEHCLLYEPIALTLASNNFLAFTHDHVGHGQSEGQRAQVDSFDKFVDDVFKHVDMIRKTHSGLDCFICGHSMGGGISILAGLRKPDYFKGVLLIGPCVATNPEVATPFKSTMAKLLRWVLPQCPIGPLDLSLVSSCPKVVESMKEDPLRYHGYAKAGFGASLLEACKTIQDNVSSISFPFIICQGEEDKLCIAEGAVLLHEKAISEDKSIKLYPKAFHNLLYEPNGIAEQVTADLVAWLTERS